MSDSPPLPVPVPPHDAADPAAAEDPFFSLAGPAHWNAFVGRQGEERYYVDGYLEAAIELTAAVIDKQLTGQRDTLVVPILFTARHGLELSLKHALSVLVAGKVIPGPLRRNHDIAAHWKMLAAVPRCDAHLPRVVAEIEPFVRSLAAVDDDGQALRYPVRRNGASSLDKWGLVNLQVVRASLIRLQELLRDLGWRVVELIDERLSGTGTNVCSRSDLLMITHRLPPRAEWTSSAFAEAKAAIVEEFQLSNRQFATALAVIQEHRQFGGMLGLEFALAHLTDGEALAAVELWRTLFPRATEPPPKAGFVIRAHDIDPERIARERAAHDAAARTLAGQLSPEALADLETLYQMGRTRVWPEAYDRRLAAMKAEHAVKDDPQAIAAYLLGKGNLAQSVADSAAALGRPRLAEAIRAL